MPELQVWSLHPHPCAAPLPPILSVPAEAKLPPQPSLSCAPLSQCWPWQFPGSWWHIQVWHCHFPSGAAVSARPPQRGAAAGSAPGCQGSGVALPVAMLPPNARLGMVGDGLGLAVFAPCLPGALSFQLGWVEQAMEGFLPFAAPLLVPGTVARACSESLSQAAPCLGPSFPSCPLEPGLFPFQFTAVESPHATTQCCSTSSESKASCMSLLHP